MPTINAKKRLQIYTRDGYKCCKCQSSVDLTVDHIVPQSKGGTNSDKNLQTMCRKCNMEKGNLYMTWKEKLFSFLVTKKEANTLRNEMLGAMCSQNILMKKDFEDRYASMKPKMQSLIDLTKSDLAKDLTELLGRDDKILETVKLIADRLQAMEEYFGIEYIEDKRYIPKE